MKRLFIAFAAAGLALGACNPVTSAIVTNQPIATGQVAVISAKSWYYANTLYNVPAAAYKSADSRQLISPSLKAVIKPKLVALLALLKAVKHAKDVGDAATFGAKIQAMETLSADVKALIPA